MNWPIYSGVIMWSVQRNYFVMVTFNYGSDWLQLKLLSLLIMT